MTASYDKTKKGIEIYSQKGMIIMAIEPNQLRYLIIVPALQAIGLHSLAAEQLVLGTCCQESLGGSYIKQLGKGPALGIYQMEPITHDDLHANFLKFKRDLSVKVNNLCVGIANASELVWNLNYATAMCRIHYFRVKAPLPAANDFKAQARYWKKYYNTPKGKGTTEEYLINWERYSGN